MLNTTLIPPLFGIIGMIVAFIIYGLVMRYDAGTDPVEATLTIKALGKEKKQTVTLDGRYATALEIVVD